MLAAYAPACPAHLLNRTAAQNAARYARTDGRTDGEAPTAECKRVQRPYHARASTCYLPHRQRALLDAVDAYRSAASPDAPPLASLIGALPGATLADWSSTPDAEPAPGVPVDTEEGRGA